MLDTNVISEFGRDQPSRRILDFLAEKPLETLFVSDIVLAEIRFGIELLDDKARRRHYDNVLNNDIRPMFAERILSAGEETWLIWKRIERAGRLRRYTFQQPDLIIAALALEHDITIVTRDVVPFQQAGVRHINPWT